MTTSELEARVMSAFAQWSQEMAVGGLRLQEVLCRQASDHDYLALVLRHPPGWAAEAAQRLARTFAAWLAQRMPELGGPHATFVSLDQSAPSIPFPRGGHVGATAPAEDHDTRAQLSALLARWCREHGEVELALSSVVRPQPPDPGRYTSGHREYGLVVDHAPAIVRADALAAAKRFVSVLDERHPECARSHIVFLRTDVAGLSAEEVTERGRHALAFARAWLDRIDARHDIEVNPEREDPLAFEVAEAGRSGATRDGFELSLGAPDVAWTLQRLYAQRHPDRALAVGFRAAGTGGESIPLSRYLRGFPLEATDAGEALDADERFLHPYRFAVGWCAALDADHDIYISSLVRDPERPDVIDVLRDDVTCDLHLDEHQVASVIGARYHARHPDRSAIFRGDYCK